ncbi:hypothetical protein [Bradyrhizobium tropiciagri]|uniref:hypothetical protein n=1 Tax=Bradyrhizobium tropiciagri TaxID=312253 RepID=UPI000A8CBDAE|nr:hypothetical protein [Bradyrhizobium tropiciagri]
MRTPFATYLISNVPRAPDAPAPRLDQTPGGRAGGTVRPQVSELTQLNDAGFESALIDPAPLKSDIGKKPELRF